MSDPSSLSKLAGLMLGNYRLEHLLEKHRWGPVFQAKDKQGTAYLVRFIGLPLQDQTIQEKGERIVLLGRLQQEANRVAALQHPSILPLLDYSSWQGVPYLVYPYVQMPSLRSLLTRPVSTDLNSVGRHLDQIASALTYAHERTVLHRNLSTRSIFLQADRQLIVAEFGLLYMHQLDLQLSNVAQNEQKSMTYEGSSESSAPELLLGKQSEVTTDVYALGAVLYRMLTGSPPFVGKTPEAVASQHLHAQVPALRAWRSGLPTELDPVIERALAKEPSLRFQSPEALVEAYYRAVSLKKQAGSVAASIAPMPSAPVETVSPDYAAHSRIRISRRYFVAAGLVAGTVTVGTIVVLMSNNALSNSNGAVPTAAPTSAAQATQPTAVKQATQPPPAATPAPARNVLARTNDIPLNSAKTFPIANQQNPGLLIHLPNKFVAFDSTCTHAGCAVSYNQGSHLLDCPCHGAIFDPAKNAAVVQGPATSPLNPVKITVHPDGTITTP